MKTTFLILCIAMSAFATAGAQTIVVSSPDATGYPAIRANLQVFDAAGEPVSGATAADFRVTENGIQRPITLFTCPPTGAVVPISSVLVLDVSKSMSFWGNNGIIGMSIAKTAALAWIDNMDLTISECAVTSFDNYSYLNQDFTTDRPSLQSAVNMLVPQGRTNYTAALLTPPNGGIPVVKNGKYKRVVIMLTDGDDNNVNSNQPAIIAAAQANNIAIYCVTVRLRMPQILKNVSEQTGGAWYENVNTPEEAARIYRSILRSVQGVKPCTIEWQTEPSCTVDRTAVIEWLPQNVRDTVRYTVSQALLPQLTSTPATVRLGGVPPGTFRDTTITLKTGGVPVRITRLSMNAPEWTIVAGAAPPDVVIPANGSHDVTIRYNSPDSLRSFAQLLIESDGCITSPPSFTAGYPRRLPRVRTLEVVHPNGGEEFLVNSDTVIKWKGVLPDEEVTLKYSIDKGLTWRDVATAATGLVLPWHAPNTPSDSCLMLAAQYDPTAGLAVTIPHDDAVIDLAFSPDGQRIYTVTRKGEVQEFSTITGQLIKKFSGTGVIGIAVNSNETYLAAYWANASSAGPSIFNPATGVQISVFGIGPITGKPSFGQKPNELVFPNNREIFSITMSGPTGGSLSTMNGHNGRVSMTQFTNDGTRLISAGTTDRTARVWNFSARTTISTLTNNSSVLWAAMSPDALKATTVDQNTRVKLWNISTSTELSTLGTGYKTTAISGDGRLAIAGGLKGGVNGFPATLWTIADGQFYRNLYGHTDTINAVVFSRDGRFAATASSDHSVIIWDMSQIAGEIQADTSDNLWKIVTSGVVARDVDMGRMQVGLSKDSVVEFYLENTGKAAVPITDIFFSGAQSGEFSILSGGAPFVLNVGEKHAVEFSFSPAAIGIRTAAINIATPSETILQNIRGEGIIIGLRAVQNVDFGKVFLGSKKDTLVQVILENTGTVDLTISGVSSDGPDKVQFTMLDAPNGFLLTAGEKHPMNLRFAPTRLGRTTGQVVFAYPEPGSPEVSLLSGEGICEDGGPAAVSTSVPLAEVNPGDTLTIPLLVKYPAGKLASSERQYTATLHYNGTLLTPLADSLRPAIPRVQQTMSLSGRQISADTLTVLRFIATLGTSDTTTLDVEGFTWEFCTASPLITDRAITVKVCAAGGKRLYMPSQTVAMLTVSPNPAGTNGKVEFATPEDGMMTVSLLDMTGRQQAVLFEGYAAKGEYTAALPVENLPPGVYYIILQTPTERIVKRLTTIR